MPGFSFLQETEDLTKPHKRLFGLPPLRYYLDNFVFSEKRVQYVMDAYISLTS